MAFIGSATNAQKMNISIRFENNNNMDSFYNT